MSVYRGNASRNSYNGRKHTDAKDNSSYVYGNTVRRRNYDRNAKATMHTVQGRKQNRTGTFTLGYVAFMTMALVAAGLILTWYISMQSAITGSVKNIASLESQLNELKQENDEAYNKANSSVDLEKIKQTAIQEYGMQYAGEGQIVTYSDNGGNDYVHQTGDIPNEK